DAGPRASHLRRRRRDLPARNVRARPRRACRPPRAARVPAAHLLRECLRPTAAERARHRLVGDRHVAARRLGRLGGPSPSAGASRRLRSLERIATMTMSKPPTESEYAPFYAGYVAK